MATATQASSSRWARQAAGLLTSIHDEGLRDELRLRFEERAGICEFDGKLSRADAERIAYEALVSATRGLAAGHVP